jgi:hypothetical protein
MTIATLRPARFLVANFLKLLKFLMLFMVCPLTG